MSAAGRVLDGPRNADNLYIMLVFRPVAFDDLTGLNDLAKLAGFGLTTLPKDPQLLENRIQECGISSIREGRMRNNRSRGNVLAGACATILFTVPALAGTATIYNLGTLD